MGETYLSSWQAALTCNKEKNNLSLLGFFVKPIKKNIFSHEILFDFKTRICFQMLFIMYVTVCLIKMTRLTLFYNDWHGYKKQKLCCVLKELGWLHVYHWVTSARLQTYSVNIWEGRTLIWKWISLPFLLSEASAAPKDHSLGLYFIPYALHILNLSGPINKH